MIYMIYSSWDVKQNILKLIISGHLLSFYPHKNSKIKILNTEKIYWRYHHFTHVYQKSQSYEVQFLRYKWDRENFLSFWANFCPFSHLTTQKIKTLKLKKTSRDITILHICTINDNHMMYFSWDMERNRQNFLSFWTIICLFTPLWTQKIKILEKWTTHPKILSFYKCVP